MRLKYFFLMLLFSGFVFTSQAQIKKQRGRVKDYHSPMNSRKGDDAFPDPMQYNMSGWLFSPGVTYMQPQNFSFVGNGKMNSNSNPKGKLGIYLELGRFKILQYSTLVRYIDYGIAYKSLRGKDKYGDLKFGDHNASLFFNANHVKSLNKNSFISNTLGANVDYAFIRNNDVMQPGMPVASLHYKLAYGYKYNSKLLIIPSIETPILKGYPFESGRSTLPYIYSRYRPIIISVRFMMIRPKEDVCPPVYAPNLPEGFSPDGMQH